MPIAAAAIAFLVNAMRIMLMAKLGAMVVKLMLFLGISFVTQKYAVGPLLDQLTAYAQGGPGSGSLAGAVAQWSGILQFDKALTMLLGAYSSAAAIRGTKVILGVPTGG